MPCYSVQYIGLSTTIPVDSQIHPQNDHERLLRCKSTFAAHKCTCVTLSLTRDHPSQVPNGDLALKIGLTYVLCVCVCVCVCVYMCHCKFSKPNILGTYGNVQFREVSRLERVWLEKIHCTCTDMFCTVVNAKCGDFGRDVIRHV